MKIGVWGAGNVGGTLGRGWAKAGHEVCFGVRRPEDPEVARLLSGIEAEGGKARAGSMAEAATFGEVVVLTVPWQAARDLVTAESAAGHLAGKVLLDGTNPLKPDLAGLDTAPDTSAGEQVAGWAPGARVIKIFNTTGFNNMAAPAYREGKATMLYCGDDASAKMIAGQLASDLGFAPVDAGPLPQARLLESFALLWITLAYRQGLGRDIAFLLMHR